MNPATALIAATLTLTIPIVPEPATTKKPPPTIEQVWKQSTFMPQIGVRVSSKPNF